MYYISVQEVVNRGHGWEGNSEDLETIECSSTEENKAVLKELKEKYQAIANENNLDYCITVFKDDDQIATQLIQAEEIMTCFKYYRIKSGMSQQKVAENLGISLTMVRNIETGRNSINDMKCITVYKIAKLFGCDIEDLLEIVEE